MHINEALKANNDQTTMVDQHGRELWIPARPINYQVRTLRERIIEAWDVFTGKADALYWGGGQ